MGHTHAHTPTHTHCRLQDLGKTNTQIHIHTSKYGILYRTLVLFNGHNNKQQQHFIMAAYHLEALRRQRVIDRKQGALCRIQQVREEDELRQQKELERSAVEKQEAEQNRRNEQEEHLRSCGKKADKNVQVKPVTDLRHQKKTLRDHGLVMGHVNEHFFHL